MSDEKPGNAGAITTKVLEAGGACIRPFGLLALVKQELVSALGGDADLSPQRRRLIDMAVRAALLLDHVDAWLFEQQSLVNQRTRTLLPVLSQRQSLADHLARLLDRLGLDTVPPKARTLGFC